MAGGRSTPGVRSASRASHRARRSPAPREPAYHSIQAAAELYAGEPPLTSPSPNPSVYYDARSSPFPRNSPKPRPPRLFMLASPPPSSRSKTPANGRSKTPANGRSKTPANSRSKTPKPGSKISPTASLDIKRHDSGYESNSPRLSQQSSRPRASMQASRPSMSASRPSTSAARPSTSATASGSRPRTGNKPPMHRSAKSATTAATPRASADFRRSADIHRASQSSFRPPSSRENGTFFHFPQYTGADGSADLEDSDLIRGNARLEPRPWTSGSSNYNPPIVVDNTPSRAVSPSPAYAVPPQTTHYWTSDRTRRLEYAAIDAASQGFKGWFMRHLVPDCFIPKDSRRVRFEDDRGSVVRYRLHLEGEEAKASGAEKKEADVSAREKRRKSRDAARGGALYFSMNDD